MKLSHSRMPFVCDHLELVFDAHDKAFATRIKHACDGLVTVTYKRSLADSHNARDTCSNLPRWTRAATEYEKTTYCSYRKSEGWQF